MHSIMAVHEWHASYSFMVEGLQRDACLRSYIMHVTDPQNSTSIYHMTSFSDLLTSRTHFKHLPGPQIHPCIHQSHQLCKFIRHHQALFPGSSGLVIPKCNMLSPEVQSVRSRA